MAGEIVDRPGLAFGCDIAWRRRHNRLEPRGEANRHHVLRDHAAKAHAGVETAGDDIGQRVVAGDFNDEIGIAPGERRHDRRDGDRQCDARRVQPEQAGDLAARRTQPLKRLTDFAQRRTD